MIVIGSTISTENTLNFPLIVDVKSISVLLSTIELLDTGKVSEPSIDGTSAVTANSPYATLLFFRGNSVNTVTSSPLDFTEPNAVSVWPTRSGIDKLKIVIQAIAC